ncbi:hypothetical protein H0H93_009506, partial [Arthromyces matolae]
MRTDSTKLQDSEEFNHHEIYKSKPEFSGRLKSYTHKEHLNQSRMSYYPNYQPHLEELQDMDMDMDMLHHPLYQVNQLE